MPPFDEDEPEVEPVVIRDEPIRASARSSVTRAKGAEAAALWGPVAVIGGIVGASILFRASRPAPAIETAPTVVTQPQPRIERESAPRQRPIRPVVREAARRVEEIPKVVVPEEKERRVVDPVKGFDTNEAFDNPSSPGRPGQRRSGLYDPNAPASSSNSTAAPSARPNRPDPSFGTPK